MANCHHHQLLYSHNHNHMRLYVILPNRAEWQRAQDRWRKKRIMKRNEGDSSNDSYIGAYAQRKRVRERECVQFDPARWASNFRCDSAGKMNNTLDDWLSYLPFMEGGSFCPSASLGHWTSPEQSLNSCHALRPLFPSYSFHLFWRCTGSMLFFFLVMGIKGTNWVFGLRLATVCLWVPPRVLFEYSWSTSAVRGAESFKSREESRGFWASGERWGERSSLWRSFYSPGN